MQRKQPEFADIFEEQKTENDHGKMTMQFELLAKHEFKMIRELLS